MGVLIILGLLISCPQWLHAQAHEIVAAEYFFDADPGEGNGIAIPITPGSVVSLNGDISTAGLSRGVHVLNVRVFRDDGYWGAATRWNVRVGVSDEIEAAETFFDSDPGEGSGIPVTVESGGVVNDLSFDVPDLTRGFHQFSIRCFSGGTWSIPAARTLRLGSALIDGAEAFYDTDPGEGNGIAVDVVSGADVIAYDTTVSLTAPSQGFHELFLRFRGGGVWSFPTSRRLRTGPEVAGGINHIVGGEYFVDSDPGIGNGCPLIAEDGVFDSGDETMRRFIAADLSLGQHVIGFRVEDSGDRWYGVLYDTVTVIEAHLTATAIEAGGTQVALAWDRFPEALSYHVHYDSVETGPFTNFLTVMPPDTSITISPEDAKRLFKVIAHQIAPEPCGEPGLTQRIQLNSQ